MFRVVTLDQHGDELTSEDIDERGKAVLRYSRVVLHQPSIHVRLIEGEELPGLPPNVVAQRFGSPCDAPCCVPLADPWPEQDPASQVVNADTKREERL